MRIHHTDNHLDKINYLLKTVLQSKAVNAEPNINSRVDVIRVERKFLDMEKFDRVIEVYRMVAENTNS